MPDPQPEKKYPAILGPLSRVSLRVRAMFEGKEIGIGTGFTYSTDGGLFFITNWHIVTGRSPTTGRTMHPMAAIPDKLMVGVPFRRTTSPERSVLWWQDAQLPLYLDVARKQPTWFEHPFHGEKVDVVAIPFPAMGEHLHLVPANDASLELKPVVLLPSLSVYVLGFPLGLAGGASFPIWKHATIASEPEFDIAPEPEKDPQATLPMIYIDTATKKGMSGAPVFVNEVGSWMEQRPDGSRVIQVSGIGRRLVGVYASRIHAENEFEAQVGIVWKAETIEEIIAGRRVGRSSFAT
jgi:hypothetical protein